MKDRWMRSPLSSTASGRVYLLSILEVSRGVLIIFLPNIALTR